jgi:tetratricopeptide (TPR) repeat protein
LWRGHWQEARATAQLGQQNARIVNSAFNMTNCSFYSEYASWELTRSPEALERMQVTAEWIEAHHLELFASCAYGWLAQALVESGQAERARSYADRALRRAGMGDPLGEASAYRALARLSAEAGKHTEAEAYLERAIQAGQRRNARHEDVKTLLLRAQLTGTRGERDAMIQYVERARELMV